MAEFEKAIAERIETMTEFKGRRLTGTTRDVKIPNDLSIPPFLKRKPDEQA